MDFTDSKERMRAVIEHFKITQTQFAREIDSPPSSISQITGLTVPSTRGIGPGIANKIVKRYPEVNINFLLNGTLPMIIPSKLIKNQKNLLSGEGDPIQLLMEQNNDLLERIIDMQQEHNELLAKLLKVLEKQNPAV